MTLYSVALFVHVLGALGLFAGLALEWAGLRRLRHATTARQVHARAATFAAYPGSTSRPPWRSCCPASI